VTPPIEIRRARQAASALHTRYWIRDANDINVDEIAALMNIVIRHGALDSAAARLVRDGAWGVIRLSAKIEHEGVRRFSVAHELGHYQLSHPSPSILSICEDAAAACVDRGLETQANAFAAELLMPERLLRRRCEVSPLSLDIPRAIASEFRVSLMAAALRFVELTSERCALVFSRDRRVLWAARSDTFRPFIPRGRLLDETSVAVDWFVGGRMYDGCQPVPADAWVDIEGAHDIEIWEDSLMIPGTGGVLTLLWLPEGAAARLSCGDA
jgi:Zn-dependent peptidase ImmA (M78 family)